MQLRDYQQQAIMQIYSAWSAGAKNILLVLPTGAGKTVIFSELIRQMRVPAIVIAHRTELVAQASRTLARAGIYHNIIGAAPTVRGCIRASVLEFKHNYVRADAEPVRVASVDTLVARPNEAWMDSIELLVQDEAHHMLRENKWGRILEKFPRARVLGVSGESHRADGRGLGIKAAGVMDTLITGPGTAKLILSGWLSPLRIFAPPSDIDLSTVRIGESGEYTPASLSAATHRSSTLTGSIVDEYLKLCAGERGLTFAVDVRAANEIAASFRKKNVPAEVVTAKTPPALRAKLVDQLASGAILQLVNVDIFGEGFDAPAVTCVSMGRATQSLQMYLQQAGRMMRVAEGKAYGVLFDHVGNVRRHGLPDSVRVQTLDGRPRREQTGDNVRIRVCPECSAAFEYYRKICPCCGHQMLPAPRANIEEVAGDLCELSSETARALLAKINEAPIFPRNASPVVIASIKKHYRQRMEAQSNLREAMAKWGGRYAKDDSQIRAAQLKFYQDFGIDVLSAQALNARDSQELTQRIAL